MAQKITPLKNNTLQADLIAAAQAIAPEAIAAVAVSEDAGADLQALVLPVTENLSAEDIATASFDQDVAIVDTSSFMAYGSDSSSDVLLAQAGNSGLATALDASGGAAGGAAGGGAAGAAAAAPGLAGGPLLAGAALLGAAGGGGGGSDPKPGFHDINATSKTPETLTGDGDNDRFIFEIGDSTPVTSGSYDPLGSPNYDNIVNFGLVGNDKGNGTDLLEMPGLAKIADTGPYSYSYGPNSVNGNAASGTVSFNIDSTTGKASFTGDGFDGGIDSDAELALAIKALMGEDIGALGSTTFFTATFSGTENHTYVYTQNGSGAGGTLVDLVGVTATSIAVYDASKTYSAGTVLIA